jgi:alpha/beta superfamily hydrolase
MGGNFLVKTRNYFAQEGLMVAVVDVPSDRSSLDYFRSGQAHAVDIRAVINWLRQTADVPVWLVGTSRGTISAAAVAGRLGNEGPDGIVLTSTLFGPSSRGTVYNADLSAIKVPVLVVHHKDDACEVTSYSKSGRFMRSVVGASKSELITINGGVSGTGNPCGPRGPHGFLGQERKVVKLITDWIKAN